MRVGSLKLVSTLTLVLLVAFSLWFVWSLSQPTQILYTQAGLCGYAYDDAGQIVDDYGPCPE